MHVDFISNMKDLESKYAAQRLTKNLLGAARICGAQDLSAVCIELVRLLGRTFHSASNYEALDRLNCCVSIH